MKRVYTAVLAMLLVLCSVLPVCAAATGDNPVPKAKQGVVSIVGGMHYDANGKLVNYDKGSGQGTGFGVGKQGENAQVFVTNCHVVATDNGICETVHILIDGAQLREENTLIECSVIYADEDVDLAIIQAKKPIAGVAALPLMPAEEMETGDTVYALGFPGIADIVADSNEYTVDDITVTDGIISRYLTSGGIKCMAHTADVNHGNSGGPLINDAGQVIGINSFIYYNNEEPDLRSYAIYIDYAMAVLDELGIVYTDASRMEQEAPQTDPTGKPESNPETDSTGKSESNPGTDSAGKSESNPNSESGKQEEPKPKYGWIIAAAVAGAVVLAGVVFVVVRKKNEDNVLVALATDGPLKGKLWTLNVNGTYRVGRDYGCDIVYPPTTNGVSRNHCTIRVYKRGTTRFLEVTDNGATYGTFVVGQKMYANATTSMVMNDTFVWLDIGSEQNRLFIGNKTFVEKNKEDLLSGRSAMIRNV